MNYFKKLVGDRIYLSPRGVSDYSAEKYTTWMNDFNVTDYIGRSSSLVSLSGENKWLEENAKDSSSRNFDILTSLDDKLIGTVSLEQFDYVSRSAVLGIFIGDSEYLSSGYGSESIKLILEFGFRYLNLHSIKLRLLSVNERAHKCYLKCGFKDTGYTRDAIFLIGRYYDELYMDILDSEFSGDYIRNKNIK